MKRARRTPCCCRLCIRIDHRDNLRAQSTCDRGLTDCLNPCYRCRALLIDEYSVVGQGRAFNPMIAIRPVLHQLDSQLLRKENLTDMGDMLATMRPVAGIAGDPHLEVNVIGPSRIKAGEDCLEDDVSLRIRALHAP